MLNELSKEPFSLSWNFIYQNAENQLSAQSIVNVHDQGDYFTGFSTQNQHVKTFKKNRVVEFVAHESDLTGRLSYWLAHRDLIPKHQYSIHFTGFKSPDKSRLSMLATEHGMIVFPSMSNAIDFLCIGYNAGAKKLEQAKVQGIIILTESELLNLMDTGELPNRENK